MDSALPLRRKLLVPLAGIGTIVAAAVLLAARHEMRAQLETQLLAQARLVADAARRIAQTGGTREDLPRFIPMLGSGQGVRSLFLIGGEPPRVIACSWPDWAGKPLAHLPAGVAQELAAWLGRGQETSRLDSRRGRFAYAAPLYPDAAPALAGVTLILEIEAARLQATILRSAWQLAGLVLLAVLAGGGLLALLLRRDVLAPLDALAGATSPGAAATLPPHAAAEFARVSTALAGAFAEVRALNSELETRVAARTAELVASLERERAASHLKGNFIAMVSHEYRTALNIIQTSARLVEKYDPGLEPAARARQLRQIHAACQRLAELVEDVLFYSRAETMGLAARPAAVDLTALAHELAAAYDDRRVQVAADGERVCATTDPALLRHALGNLLHNAVKYSPGEKPVHLGLSREPGATVLTITDHGPGIPTTDLPRLFEPFQRGRNVAAVPGTGLGLHIARRCVEALRGTISIESAEGAGTTARVRLPAS